MSDERRPPRRPTRPPSPAREIFGERLPLAIRYAELLADEGVLRGLIGPRETPRLWTRHLLNCAVVESLLPHRSRVIDVGSGAGLPGLVLALTRPDIDVLLVEPLLRRTTWLEEVVRELQLSNVQVLRGRAQDFHGRLDAPVVTARAVARLSELAPWYWPLIQPGGRMLAMKGETAAQELDADRATLGRLEGLASAQVLTVGSDMLATPTRVIEVVRGSGRRRPQAPQRRGARAGQPG